MQANIGASGSSRRSPSPSRSSSRRDSLLQARDGWRPPSELVPGRYKIGGGVPAGKGVPPIGLFGQDGHPVQHPPIEDLKWTGSSAPAPVAGADKGKGKATEENLTPANEDSRQWSCAQVGACQACPQDSLHFPYCQPYGNRITVTCTPLNSDGSLLTKDAVSGWQQCGKVIAQERRDFLEFSLLNIVIVMVSFILLIRRQKWLGEKQYAALTQRINS